LVPKSLRGSNSPLFWRFFEFLRSKKFARKISPQKGIKIVFFWKNVPKYSGRILRRYFYSKAFQQSLNRGQKTVEKPNFGKKIVAASPQPI
jgi:hypothetical protein